MFVSVIDYKKSWSIKLTKRINSSKEEIWNLISSPNNLELFHPFCKSNKIIKWPGEGSSDELIYLNDFKLIRNFIEWRENEGYKLLIGRKNGKKSLVIWEIFEENSSVNLSIEVYPHFLREKSKIFSFIPHHFIVKPNLKKYLNSVLSGLDWYLVNKKNIPENYFGKHKWFSK